MSLDPHNTNSSWYANLPVAGEIFTTRNFSYLGEQVQNLGTLAMSSLSPYASALNERLKQLVDGEAPTTPLPLYQNSQASSAASVGHGPLNDVENDLPDVTVEDVESNDSDYEPSSSNRHVHFASSLEEIIPTSSSLLPRSTSISQASDTLSFNQLQNRISQAYQAGRKYLRTGYEQYVPIFNGGERPQINPEQDPYDAMERGERLQGIDPTPTSSSNHDWLSSLAGIFSRDNLSQLGSRAHDIAMQFLRGMKSTARKTYDYCSPLFRKARNITTNLALSSNATSRSSAAGNSMPYERARSTVSPDGTARSTVSPHGIARSKEEESSEKEKTVTEIISSITRQARSTLGRIARDFLKNKPR